jgi:sarcosine oxidase
VRRAYPDAFFTACMAEAYPMWAELEEACGQKLVDECGLLYIGDAGAPRVTAMVAALEALSVPHSVCSPAEAAAMLPSLTLGADDVAVFTPEAGWVDAAAALRASYELGREHGLQLSEEAGDFARLDAECDAVVVAPGAWIKGFVDLDVTPTLQTFGYLGPPEAGPVWIDDTSLTYGIPSDRLGHKIGAHLPGPVIDADRSSREPWPEHLRQIEGAARSRFGMTQPQLRDVKTCIYTSTSSEDFRIGRMGRRGVFASACSGHGFKMGPWVGRILANIVEGKDDPSNHPRFEWPSRTI